MLSDTPVGAGAPGGVGVAAQFRAVTGQLLPAAFTTNCEEVTDEDDVVAQPVNMFNPTRLTTNKRSSDKRRPFLKPKKPNKAANIVPANKGPGPR
jgi:hypothetical protein